MRKYPIATGQIYHVMNKSIAGYEIFHRPGDYEYMLKAIRYFSLPDAPSKFSYFMKMDPVVLDKGFEAAVQDLVREQSSQVQLIAYCLMPTHFHLLVRQNAENGIAELLRKVLNAYARYFNTKYERKGPLWVGPFKNVPITNDEQLLHVTRYIHLNPVTAGLCKKAEEWPYSSYMEFVNRETVEFPITNYGGLIDIVGEEHRQFCEDQAGYQRGLATIKDRTLE